MSQAVMLDLPRLVCRPALPKDTADILELTSKIWNGHDYVPLVWQDWLADPQGLLVVAEFGTHLVGMGKLTRLNQENWWLEGLRVHPEFEGRGIATHLQEYLVATWERIGSGAVRLATSSQRIPVHRICRRTGFEQVAEITAFEAPATTENRVAPPESKEKSLDESFTPLRETDFEPAWKSATSNPLYDYWAGFIDLGWQWMPLERDILAQKIQAGQAYCWRGLKGLIVLGEDDDDSGQKFAVLQYVSCPVELLKELLHDFRSLAGRLGYEKASWIAPVQPVIETSLAQAGFERAWEISLYLFEKWYNPAR